MRQLLLFAATLFLASACQSPAPPPRPFPSGTLIDLTYAYDENTVYWPTAEGFALHVDAAGVTENGYYYAANSFSTAEHGGTHLDAPIHFAEGKQSTEAIPLERLVGPAVIIDVAAEAAADRDYLITQADIEAWEAEHEATVDGHIVLFRTGFGQYWPDREQYMGTAERGADAVAKLHFPGISPEAARWLATKRSVKAVGIDTPSIDYGQSTLFETHQALFQENIPAFENVANLEALPPMGFAVIALPMKIKGGSGGPLRIIAVLPEE